ncbi:MAG: hypothetical protein HY815_19170 [Candidatus Riflebacteria bacterium]|nr:hypothetical protein [Candidatus Riflebacteria bacterium]
MEFHVVATALAFVAGLGLIWTVLAGTVQLATALDGAMLLLALGWLFLLVKIPWDLYFNARRARLDGEESVRREIRIDQARLGELSKLESRLLCGALGAHVLTALAVVVISRASGGAVRSSFAWLFLISAAFRPAWELHLYLKERLEELGAQMRYPREDVHQLRAEVRLLEATIEHVKSQGENARIELAARVQILEAQASEMLGQHAAAVAGLERRLFQLSDKFESAVAQVTKDQELLAGVRAFARVFREQTA